MFVIEVFYRGYVYFEKPIYRPSSFPNLGCELTPGAKVLEENIEGFPVTYLINLSGFRDITNGAWTQWKSDDLKVVFIGDSVTYGSGVEFEDTYSNVVELFFAKKGLPVRTINLGISGFDTLQYFAILKNKAIPLNPDIIILGYFLNDTATRMTQKLPRILQYVLRHFHFGVFLISRIHTFLKNWNAKKQRICLYKKERIRKQELYVEDIVRKSLIVIAPLPGKIPRKLFYQFRKCVSEGV